VEAFEFALGFAEGLLEFHEFTHLGVLVRDDREALLDFTLELVLLALLDLHFVVLLVFLGLQLLQFRFYQFGILLYVLDDFLLAGVLGFELLDLLLQVHDDLPLVHQILL